MQTPEERLAAQPIELKRYRCPGCGAPNQFAALEDSPTIAKHKCRYCDRVNEVETRANVFDALTTGGSFDDYVEDSKMKNKWEQHPSVTVDFGATTEEATAGGKPLRIVDRRRKFQ